MYLESAPHLGNLQQGSGTLGSRIGHCSPIHHNPHQTPAEDTLLLCSFTSPSCHLQTFALAIKKLKFEAQNKGAKFLKMKPKKLSIICVSACAGRCPMSAQGSWSTLGWPLSKWFHVVVTIPPNPAPSRARTSLLGGPLLGFVLFCFWSKKTS